MFWKQGNLKPKRKRQRWSDTALTLVIKKFTFFLEKMESDNYQMSLIGGIFFLMQITDWRPFFSPAPSIWTLTKTHPPRKHKHAKMCLSTKPVPQFKNVSYNKHESTCKKIPFHFCGPSVLSWHLCLLRRLASANGPHLRTQPVPSRDSVSLAPSEGEKLGMCYLKSSTSNSHTADTPLSSEVPFLQRDIASAKSKIQRPYE